MQYTTPHYTILHYTTPLYTTRATTGEEARTGNEPRSVYVAVKRKANIDLSSDKTHGFYLAKYKNKGCFLVYVYSLIITITSTHLP